jgi:C4-dicarboxylate transporter, DctM subunit
MTEALAEIPALSNQTPEQQHFLHRVEDAAVSLLLAAMVLIPLLEAILRRSFHTGIPASTSLVQHAVLLVGMIGAVIAAREGRLLALSNIEQTWLPDRFRASSRVFTSSVAAGVTAFLAFASWQFVAIEREVGSFLIGSVRIWWIEAAMPVGFILIALRLLLRSSGSWRTRAFATVLTAVVVAVSALSSGPSHRFLSISLSLLALATVLGLPAFVTLGGIALVLFSYAEQPIGSISISHYQLVINPVLPTLPLFTLAGYFLAEGGAARRLVRLFSALFSTFRGGPALLTVLVCAFFTSVTGASGVTILALGGLLMPVLVQAGYKDKESLGLITGSGSLGLLLPPCLPIIVYAIVARVPIQEMFLGSLLPAFVMIIATSIWGVRSGPRFAERTAFHWREAKAALWEAKWELLMPIVALVALFAGFATPVEASALTALYAFLIEAVVHRDLHILRDVPRVMSECGLLIGGVLLILGVSLGFTNYLVDAEVPARAVEWTTRNVHSPFVFLLFLNFFMLIVGCLIEIYPAIVIEVPLLVPLGAAFGVDPVRLGIIFLANLELGYLTPPVGLNLLMSSYRFRKPVGEVMLSVMPVVGVLSVGVLLITYIPGLTTMLPKLLGF